LISHFSAVYFNADEVRLGRWCA